MNKQHILAEIKRTAQENGGKPLGSQRFFAETGIRKADWYGKYWARWGDALHEVGFSPNELKRAYDKDQVIESFIGLIRELGRFPVSGEVRLKRQRDPAFPSHNVFTNLGSKSQLISKLLKYCRTRSGFEDVAAICMATQEQKKAPAADDDASTESVALGFVYLLKSGRHYKIGKTNAVGRRERELAIQLPEKPRRIHEIKTDDLAGIEEYWHKRFAARRKDGEWFELESADVAAFKRRKFM